MSGRLSTETEGLMQYALDRRRTLSAAMLKSQTTWDIKDKISASLSKKEKEIMRADSM